MQTLNITNGSHSVDLMNAAGISGDKLSWDDLLHEGPVPGGLTLEELSIVRANYIVSQGYANETYVKNKFFERDRVFRSYAQYNQVVLWFEHDLYDQLQLIQILDWFNQRTKIDSKLYLICTDNYLGHHTPEQIALLKPLKQLVTSSQLALATNAWRALTSTSQNQIDVFLTSDLSELKYLESALRRLILEYPNKNSGLPFTEQLILQALHNSSLSPIQLFKDYQSLEQTQFMGDSTFWIKLNQMAFCDFPIVRYTSSKPISHPIEPEQTVSITEYGKQCLAKQANWFSDNLLEKYVGGYKVKP